MFPVLGLCFQESELILLTATIASKGRQGPKRRDRGEIVCLTQVEEPRECEVETSCVLVLSGWGLVSQRSKVHL